MTNTVSIVLPSIYRINTLKACLNSLNLFTTEFETTVYLVTEDDNTAQFFTSESYSFQKSLIYNETRLGYMAAWNIALKYIPDGIVFPIGDDGVLTDGALQKVVKLHREKLDGYGVVGFNDGYIPNDIVCTHFILDREFIKNELGGVMLCPHYNAFFADNEVNERAKRINKLTWDNTALLYHEHSSRGKRAMDSIDEAKVQYWEHDEKLFHERKAAGFPDDFLNII